MSKELPLAMCVLIAHPIPDLYGSDRMLAESVRALIQAGHRVVVVLPTAGPLVPLLLALGAEVRYCPTVILRRRYASPAGALYLVGAAAARLPAMLRLCLQIRPDLIYVSTMTLPLWLLAGRLTAVPSVCHVHEAEEGLRRVVAMALSSPLLLVRQVLVNSCAAERCLSSALPSLSGRIKLIYNGVQKPPSPKNSREELDEPVRLLLVGRISPRKGTDVAVLAVAELLRRGINVKLDVVGDVFPGYEWFLQQLRSTIEDNQIGRNVCFRGFHADVWPLLSSSDIVLVPSRSEPFGNVAVEAAFARRPVVASKVQGLEEIISSGRTGMLVASSDPIALADGIQHLVEDWPRAREMAELACKQAEARFEQDRFACELVSALQAAVPKRVRH